MSRIRSLFAAGLLFAAGAFAQVPCSLDAALAAYTAGDYARSADLFDRARGCARFEATDHYNAACAQALAGRADAAFASLERAVGLGWANVEHLTADTDLASLHADPRWAGLLAAAGALAANDRRIWGGAAFETPYRDELPEEERIAGLARYWAEVRSNFAFFDQVPELDWDAAFLETLPKVRAAKSTADYYRELQALNARLHDGHTNVYPPRDLRPRFYTKPALRTAKIEGKVLITRLLDPALASAGLAPGLEVVSGRRRAGRGLRRAAGPSLPGRFDAAGPRRANLGLRPARRGGGQRGRVAGRGRRRRAPHGAARPHAAGGSREGGAAVPPLRADAARRRNPARRPAFI
ncbi:MAG: hypothetical protein F9K16_14505 [Thermoanaerobaculia bacterium]|nr:MAG: hypothetical protein F9K16_14505 [Thermoanaerobaculia bacterium]MBZ0101167.1 hypothetical protein [Thermoanaerobaculia bacterium]